MVPQIPALILQRHGCTLNPIILLPFMNCMILQVIRQERPETSLRGQEYQRQEIEIEHKLSTLSKAKVKNVSLGP